MKHPGMTRWMARQELKQIVRSVMATHLSFLFFSTEILYYITIFHGLNNDGWHREHSITDASISQNLNRVLSKLSKFRQGGSESGVARNLFEAERYVERSVIYFIAFDNAVAVEEVDFVPTHNDRSG